MAVDISSYTSVQSNTFVRIDVPDYQVLRFSDYHISYDIGGETYDNLGNLVSISNTSSELRSSPEQVNISISGIPSNFISTILSSKLKNSDVQIYRALFDSTSGIILPITDNPTIKFRGVVSNFEIADDLDEGGEDGTIILGIECTSVVQILSNKIVGRRTNPIDQKTYFPNDLCFDRVPALAKSNFNFGAPE